jgi:hypothetical protein
VLSYFIKFALKILKSNGGKELKDGYYISLYVNIGLTTYLFDIDGLHDQNIALWKKDGNNVELVHYWELERLSGIKQHAKSFFSMNQVKLLLTDLIGYYGLTLRDINEIWEDSNSGSSIEKNERCKDYSFHSMCHLYSAIALDSQLFYNEKILAMVLDGAPNMEQTRFSYVGSFINRGKIEYFPVCSPAMLWWCLAQRYHMREGSLMALGTASTSSLIDIQDEMILIDSVFPMLSTLERINKYIKKIEFIVNNLEEKDKGLKFTGFDKRFSLKENRLSMIVKLIQNMSVKIVEKNIESAIAAFSIDTTEVHLAGAGGFILNCTCNSQIMSRYKFKSFIAPPCVNDAGISLGIGLREFYKRCERIEYKYISPYMGNGYKADNDYWINGEWAEFIDSVHSFDADIAAKDISIEPVAWFEERAEMGPRALGHRSILIDPQSLELKAAVNTIKQRQWWRPVAPIVLEEHMEEWFENVYPSPYMLHAFRVRSEKKNIIAAALHLDDTARIQTLKRNDNGYIVKVVEAFAKRTGIPIICNTSLNDRGEPIIDNISQTLNFCLRKNIRVLYVNGQRIILKNHDKYTVKVPLEREMKYKSDLSQEVINYYRKKINPCGVPPNILKQYIALPELRALYDIKKASDAEVIKKIISEKYSLYMDGVKNDDV